MCCGTESGGCRREEERDERVDDTLVMSMPRGPLCFHLQLLLWCLRPLTLALDLNVTLCGLARLSDKVITHTRQVLRWEPSKSDRRNEKKHIWCVERNEGPTSEEPEKLCEVPNANLVECNGSARKQKNRWTINGPNKTCTTKGVEETESSSDKT